MRILIIGHQGQLGSDLKKTYENEELILLNQQDMPVENAELVKEVVGSHRPQLILNCSAFHRVDDCESQVERAFEVNAYGARNLGQAAREVDATVVHFSTDYVFDGPERTPHAEDDYPSPACVYAASKLAGEFLLAASWPKHFIIRSCGLYGYAGSREKGTNFVEMMIGLGRKGQPVRVVNDQVLTPTSTIDLAHGARKLVDTKKWGLYHLTSSGECSWYEFARAIFEFAGLRPDLHAVTSDAFPTRAKRPNYSVLDNRRYRELGFEDLPPWRDALKSYIDGRAAAGRT